MLYNTQNVGYCGNCLIWWRKDGLVAGRALADACMVDVAKALRSQQHCPLCQKVLEARFLIAVPVRRVLIIGDLNGIKQFVREPNS
jgi:hypothetical protein